MAKRTSSTRKKKLTPAEKRALVKAHTKAVKFTSGKSPTADKRDRLLALAETLKQRPKPVVGMAAITLWAAKIDWAIVNGDVPAVVKLIKLPIGPEALPKGIETQLWDSNGNCGCGGGGGTTTK